MIQTIPLSMLRAFEAAGRAGSFRAAATELRLTPSAVSHAIRKLEDVLGARLFHRQTRAVELTAEGQMLMRHVGRAFETLRLGMEAVSTRMPSLLRLHCAPSFAAQVLAPRLQKFLTTNPDLEVRIAASTNYARFDADEFDADIVYANAPFAQPTPGLIRISLGEEIVTPLMAPSRAHAISKPSDTLCQTLIHSDNKQIRWPDWFAANGLDMPPPHGLRFDRSFIAISTAADSLGIALESTRLAEREILAGRLVAPLLGQGHDMRYIAHFLVFPVANQGNPLLGRFTRWLLDELRKPLAVLG